MCLFSCFLLPLHPTFCLVLSVCILVYHVAVPVVTLDVRGELNRIMFSVHIYPHGTHSVRAMGPCGDTADFDLCRMWGYFASNVWKHFLFCNDSQREMLTLASGAFLLALSTSRRFTAEEDKHALVGILLSSGINLPA